MIVTIDASYLYFFVVRKQQPLVNNIHVRDDTVGVSTAVSVMSVVQSERQFSSSVEIRACFTISPAGVGIDTNDRLRHPETMTPHPTREIITYTGQQM